jgi:predicted lipoprotein with Yx(FWY)xxD motif
MKRLHARLAALAVGLAALAVVAAGCGGAVPSSNGRKATVKVGQSKLGRILVDGRGHTLYLFERDERGESYCNGACAAVWPPFEADGKPQAGGGISSSALGTTKRDDGDMQVTYHGHPLYYYAADASTPGKTTGEDVDQFGASWYALDSGGSSVEPSDSGSGGSSSGGSSSSGGGSSGGSSSGNGGGY